MKGVEEEKGTDYQLFMDCDSFYNIKQYLIVKIKKQPVAFKIDLNDQPDEGDKKYPLWKLRAIRPDITQLEITGDLSKSRKRSKILDGFKSQWVFHLILTHSSQNGQYIPSSNYLQKIYMLNPSILKLIFLRGFSFTGKEFNKLLLVASNASQVELESSTIEIDTKSIPSRVMFKLGKLYFYRCKTLGDQEEFDFEKIVTLICSCGLKNSLDEVRVPKSPILFTKKLKTLLRTDLVNLLINGLNIEETIKENISIVNTSESKGSSKNRKCIVQ
ncbi:unnamed protein product [Moneuplotes crassus]|uniref:Uncharacterized protein n=1 Tax=Euplotes crassus TaxID=5936 RepID=A0AAD1XMB6_EUPCR|nr:unnamed protein product [Moneuplotes crassus]